MQYNNQFNTIGIGNPMPPRKPCMTGADFADERNNGSGDLFPLAGQSPTELWPEEWKQKREECLKKQKEMEGYVYSLGEERPLLVFVDEPLPNEKDYQPLCGGQPSMSDRLKDW